MFKPGPISRFPDLIVSIAFCALGFGHATGQNQNEQGPKLCSQEVKSLRGNENSARTLN